MSLILDDPETDRLAQRLADKRNVSKAEAVRQALERDLARVESEAAFVEGVMEIVRDLRAKRQPAKAGPVDKAFIDSLYE